tara:strand:- start:729 stop:1748 length:1020 start_codon:yes stop_codon:yes gene_type:complete
VKIQAKLFIKLIILAFAYYTTSESVKAQNWMDEDDIEPIRRGIEFGLNMGIYQPFSKKPNINDPEEKFRNNAANFYNGTGNYDLGDNSAIMNSISDRFYDTWTSNRIVSLLQNAGYNVDGGLNEAETPIIPYDNMTYETSMLFGLRVAGFFNSENAIVMSADFVSLKASGVYQIEFNYPQPTNQMDRYYDGEIFGEERRFIGSLGYRTSLYINRVSSWLLEIGGTATGTQVLRNYFVVEGEPFQLIYQNIAPGQYNTQTSNLSNMGFGGYFVFGVEGIFEKGGNLEANFRFSYDRIKLGSQEENDFDEVNGYRQMQSNFSIYVTWMIPSQIGDFVRASF